MAFNPSKFKLCDRSQTNQLLHANLDKQNINKE